MFHDRILRAAEIKEFQGTLKPHQLATISLSSNDRLAAAVAVDDEPSESERTGPSTVLDRAVMEHNLLACSKIYSNITFLGLGNLLDLSPSAAETMARRMIEQGRLKGTIDQVDRLIWFDTAGEDDDAQGKAGGLGDVEQVTEDTGAPYTKRWDMQIRLTAANVSITLSILGLNHHHRYNADKRLAHQRSNQSYSSCQKKGSSNSGCCMCENAYYGVTMLSKSVRGP